MSNDRLTQQLRFILEIDKLKQVLRQTPLSDGSRRENSAEHSWHLALMTVLLAEYSNAPVDVPRVIKMLLVHDIVEVDAGDTFAYDRVGARDQAERERRAAERLFGLLPDDQARELRALWEEFEERKSAVALDRLQPLLLNFQTKGLSWQQHGITIDRVHTRAAPIQEASEQLGHYVHLLLTEALAAGFVTPAPDKPT
jgi:putative hydrolase of HD superfamily